MRKFLHTSNFSVWARGGRISWGGGISFERREEWGGISWRKRGGISWEGGGISWEEGWISWERGGGISWPEKPNQNTNVNNRKLRVVFGLGQLSFPILNFRERLVPQIKKRFHHCLRWSKESLPFRQLLNCIWRIHAQNLTAQIFVLSMVSHFVDVFEVTLAVTSFTERAHLQRNEITGMLPRQVPTEIPLRLQDETALENLNTTQKVQ